MELDWKNLGFGIMETDYNVRCVFKDGKWGDLEVSSDQYLPIHIGATCLHYGQESFEGLKHLPDRTDESGCSDIKTMRLE